MFLKFSLKPKLVTPQIEGFEEYYLPVVLFFKKNLRKFNFLTNNLFITC